MENATDAIIMAASVLLLLIALSVGISSFSRVKTQFDGMVQARENIRYASANGTYFNYLQSNKYEYARSVQFESIISALRRLRKENYDVYIFLNDDEIESIKTKIENFTKYKYEFKFMITPLIDDEVTFGEKKFTKGKEVIRFTLSGVTNKVNEGKESGNGESEFDIFLNLLYNYIGGSDKTFKEYFGMYQYKTENVSSENKSTQKVITYVEQ